MNFSYSPYIIPLFVAAIVSGWVMLYTWQRRAAPELSAARVIICSANELQAGVLQDEADVVMLKPVSPAQLRSIALRLSGR